MQKNADFITADFLYMFRASHAHHQEYKNTDTATTGTGSSVKYKIITLTSWPRYVSVIMLYFTELPVPVAAVWVVYTPDDGRLTPETCRESLQ